MTLNNSLINQGIVVTAGMQPILKHIFIPIIMKNRIFAYNYTLNKFITTFSFDQNMILQ